MENIEFNKLTESLPINSDKDFINFSEFRKVLKEEDNLIGKTEKFGVRFTRKFVNNVLDNTLRLYYTNVKRIVKENTKLIANLCIVHGFGHHSQEFYELAFYLANQGINCHLIDFRGSGYSGGCRFDWTIEELQTDLITLIKTAEVDGIDLPIFIFGHSMGGGLVASLFINNQYLQVNGVILSAPLLGLPLNQPPNTLKFFLLSKLGNDMKEFLLNGRINPSDLCKDDRVVLRILEDKKIIPFANPRAFRSIIKNCERLLENCRYFNLPCLVIHGDKDKVCSLADSEMFIKNIKHKIKELFIIKDGYHEMYHDFEKEIFMQKVLSWITKTINFGKTDKREFYLN